MSKTILLYSEDNKYKCAVELADSLDRFNCPDHSVLVLFEERENGTYIIAQARDKKLETEKDDEINYLKMHLSEIKQQLAEKDKWLTATDEHIGQLKKREQDKISFCIEQLEKVKEYNSKLIYGDEKLNKFIDNQIKQLKEMK